MATKDEIKQALIDAKKLIENPGNWLQGHYAETLDKYHVRPLNPNACKFCASGAIARACNDFNPHGLYGDVCYYMRMNIGIPIPTFNDKSSHSQVLKIFDDVISQLDLTH